jgi:hypothetical protein
MCHPNFLFVFEEALGDFGLVQCRLRYLAIFLMPSRTREGG